MVDKIPTPSEFASQNFKSPTIKANVIWALQRDRSQIAERLQVIANSKYSWAGYARKEVIEIMKELRGTK